MKTRSPSITIPVDLTNPGQFFACCGLLELADRLWLGTEGWFEGEHFLVIGPPECSLRSLLGKLAEATIDNTMTPIERERLEKLSSMKKREREAILGLEDERKSLESLRRELPIALSGTIEFRVDWFCDQTVIIKVTIAGPASRRSFSLATMTASPKRLESSSRRRLPTPTLLSHASLTGVRSAISPRCCPRTSMTNRGLKEVISDQVIC